MSHKSSAAGRGSSQSGSNRAGYAKAKGAPSASTKSSRPKANDPKANDPKANVRKPSNSKAKRIDIRSGSKAQARNKEYDVFFKEQRPKRKKRKKERKLTPIGWLFRGVLVCCCLVLAWCLFAYYMVIFNEQQSLYKADAGIILGAALWNNEPSPALKERLDYAAELYEQGLIDYFILSGGKPSYSRGLSEAEGMKQYLMEAGIPEQQLLLETQSRDTYENLLFSKRVLDKEQLQSVIIISHNYHTKRAEDIAAYVGIEHVQTAGVKTKVLNEGYHYTREMLAYSKWQLNKLLMPLGIML